MADGVVVFNDENFSQAALQNPLPVLVDFWAEWCGPCRMLTPIVDEIAKEMSGTVVVGKVNVDDSPKTAARYGVTSIPTLLFIKSGEVVDQHTGLLAQKPLRDKVRRVFQLA
jgi:thioredoxin 1